MWQQHKFAEMTRLREIEFSVTWEEQRLDEKYSYRNKKIFIENVCLLYLFFSYLNWIWYGWTFGRRERFRSWWPKYHLLSPYLRLTPIYILFFSCTNKETLFLQRRVLVHDIFTGANLRTTCRTRWNCGEDACVRDTRVHSLPCVCASVSAPNEPFSLARSLTVFFISHG